MNYRTLSRMLGLLLVTVGFVPSALGVDLSTLVYRRQRETGGKAPTVNFSHFKDSRIVRELHESLGDFLTFANRLKTSVLVPQVMEVDITRGEHYLAAHCFPFEDKIVIDESAWGGHPYIWKGLMGHEFGHLVFREGMAAMFMAELGRIENVELDRLAKLLVSDADLLEGAIQKLEKEYPVLRRLEFGAEATGVDLRMVGQYQTMRSILRAVPKSETVDLTGDELVKRFFMEGMGGIQEVYSDLVGAVYTENPSYLKFVLQDEVSREARDFAGVGVDVLRPEMRRRLIESASRGVPHLLLLQLRQKIYDEFYRSRGVWMGKNPAYDDRILQEVLQSFTRQLVKVYRDTAPLKYREAAAALPLIIKQVIGNLIYEIEVKANAIGVEYRIHKVTVAQDSYVYENCATQVTNPRLERFRERVRERSSEPKQQQMRYREGGQQ